MGERGRTITRVQDDPLAVSQTILQHAGLEQDNSVRGEGTAARMRAALSQELHQSDLDEIADVQSLGIEHVRPGTLVRARGMVQDMLGQEVYADAIKCGGVWYSYTFHEAPPCHHVQSAEETMLGDRSVLHVVPVPAECQWVKQRHAQSFHPTSLRPDNGTSSAAPSLKRSRTDDVDAENTLSKTESGEKNCSHKKLRADDADSESAQLDRAQQHLRKRGRHDAANENNYLPYGSSAHSFPLLAKVYNTDDEPKLNEVVELIGVLSAPQPGDGEAASDDADFPAEEEAHSPPHSQVPRLHCIMVLPERATPPLDRMPQLAHVQKQQVEEQTSAKEVTLLANTDEAALPTSASLARSWIVEDIAAALGSDDFAAEHVLLALTAKVHARPNDMALGKLPLNLIGAPERDGASAEPVAVALARVLSRFVPRVLHLSLTLDGMNKAEWTPKKDNEADRLRSGLLQLATGTVVVVDETRLEQGTLHSTGVANCKALASIMDTQKLEYDFGFYTLPQETDVQVIVVSSARTFLAPDAMVQLSNPEGTTVDNVPARTDEQLDAMRTHLSASRKLAASITVSEAVCSQAEDDMVNARKADASIGQDTFHRWLTLSRLSAASARHQCVTRADWEHARFLSSKQRHDAPAQHAKQQQQDIQS